MKQERLVDEIVLLPESGRGLGSPLPPEVEVLVKAGAPAHAFPSDARVSPRHIQVLIALAGGPIAVGRIAEVLGVSGPVATQQVVDRLVEHGWIERRHDPEGGKVVLVAYVPGMHEMARRIMDVRRRVQLNDALDALTDEEAAAFYKVLKEVTTALGRAPGKDN